MRLEKISILTNGSGAYTGYTRSVSGKVHHLRYVVDATSPLDTGADVTLTGETTGVAIATLTNIGTASFTKAPRQPTHGLTGTALVYAGTDPVSEPVAVASERIKLVVAEGGAAKLGTLYVVLDDE